MQVFKTDWKGPRGSLQVVREGKAKIAMHQLRRIIKETVGQFAPTAAEEAVNVNSQVSGHGSADGSSTLGRIRN